MLFPTSRRKENRYMIRNALFIAKSLIAGLVATSATATCGPSDKF